MTIDADIYRSAHMLRRDHGADAANVALRRANDQRDRGSREGATIWHLIQLALAEIEAADGDAGKPAS